MPRSDTFDLAPNAWTQLTNSDTAALTFQIKRGIVEIMATAGAVAPVSLNGALTYRAEQGEAGIALATLFGGVAGANRVYAWTGAEGASVTVSHA